MPIRATIDELTRGSDNTSSNIRSIVDRVKPSVQSIMSTELRNDADALVKAAIRANVRASADHLRHGSEIIEKSIADDGLLVVGAEYSLETGTVDFFDGLP